MKLVFATIRPLDWDVVRAALDGLGVDSIDVTEVKLLQDIAGHGRPYHGAQYIVDHLPQLRLEIGVDEDMVAPVIAAIESATGVLDKDRYIVNPLIRRHAIGSGSWVHKSCNEKEWV